MPSEEELYEFLCDYSKIDVIEKEMESLDTQILMKKIIESNPNITATEIMNYRTHTNKARIKFRELAKTLSKRIGK